MRNPARVRDLVLGAALETIVVPLNSWWRVRLTALRTQGEAVVAFVDEERRPRVIADGRPAGLQLVTVRTEGRRRRSTTWCSAPLGSRRAVDPDDPVTLSRRATGRPKGRARYAPGCDPPNIWNMASAA
jgi:hypothetical protein